MTKAVSKWDGTKACRPCAGWAGVVRIQSLLTHIGLRYRLGVEVMVSCLYALKRPYFEGVRVRGACFHMKVKKAGRNSRAK